MPNGEYAYVTCGSTVSVINTSTNLVIKTIQVNNGSLQIPNGAAIAITPDGKYAYVTYGPYLAVINTANNTVTKMIGFDSALNNVSLNLNNVAISPNGQYAYVSSGWEAVDTWATNESSVFVINTATNSYFDDTIWRLYFGCSSDTQQ